MKCVWYLAASALFGSGLVAQTIEEIPLRPGVFFAAGAKPEEVIYRSPKPGTAGFNRALRSISVPTLTLYRPTRTAHRGAALIVCPGGGYEDVVIDREGYAFGRYFQNQGLTVVVLKYRLPDPAATGTGLPYSQQDALAAISLVHRRAAGWGVNPRLVGILGCSAGGHLAGSAALDGKNSDETRPDFTVLLYPVVCMVGPYVHAGSRLHLLGAQASEARRRSFSLELNVRPALPPFFLVHARDDRVVPFQDSQLLNEALHKVGVPSQLVLLPTGGHGLALGENEDPRIWTDQFLHWLDALP